VAPTNKDGDKRKTTQAGVRSDKMQHFSRKRDGVQYDFRSFSNPLFGAAVMVLASEGMALMLGAAQGGGGILLSIYADGDKHKTFVADKDQFTTWCYDVIETFGSTSEDVLLAWGLPQRGE
jgi:hypothetical protein